MLWSRASQCGGWTRSAHGGRLASAPSRATMSRPSTLMRARQKASREQIALLVTFDVLIRAEEGASPSGKSRTPLGRKIAVALGPGGMRSVKTRQRPKRPEQASSGPGVSARPPGPRRDGIGGRMADQVDGTVEEKQDADRALLMLCLDGSRSGAGLLITRDGRRILRRLAIPA